MKFIFSNIIRYKGSWICPFKCNPLFLLCYNLLGEMLWNHNLPIKIWTLTTNYSAILMSYLYVLAFDGNFLQIVQAWEFKADHCTTRILRCLSLKIEHYFDGTLFRLLTTGSAASSCSCASGQRKLESFVKDCIPSKTFKLALCTAFMDPGKCSLSTME